jgi:hypothetical protein
MDLGRPLARHHIRRPHEVIDLKAANSPDEEVTRDAEPAADELPLSSETTER